MDELLGRISVMVNKAYEAVDIAIEGGSSPSEVDQLQGYAEGAGDVESMLLKHAKENQDV